MLYFGKMENYEREILRGPNTKVRKYKFESMTKKEQDFIKKIFDEQYSYFITYEEVHKIMGFEGKMYANTEREPEVKKMIDYVLQNGLIFPYQKEKLKQIVAFVLNEIETKIKKMIEKDGESVLLETVVQEIAYSILEQEEKMFVKEITSKEIAKDLKNMGRDDLAVFVEKMCRDNVRFYINHSFEFELKEKKYISKSIEFEKEFEEKTEIIKEIMIFENDEEKRKFDRAINDIIFFLEDKKRNDEEDYWDDEDEWWEVVGEPREKACQLLNKEIEEEMKEIFELWKKTQKHVLKDFEKMFKNIVAIMYYKENGKREGYKEVVRETLKKEKDKIFVTKVFNDSRLDGMDYFIWLEK